MMGTEKREGGLGRIWLDRALRWTAAGILAQTLYFKFTGAPESVYIFSTLHLEPWGRLAAGLGELVAVALLLVPSTGVLGAGVTVGILSGAIASHLTVLGIEVQGDGGLLFGLAVIVEACALGLLVLRREEVFALGARFGLHRLRQG